MALIEAKCPNCGAMLKVDDAREVFFCEFCGTKIINATQKVDINVTHKVDRTGCSNLYIEYSAVYSASMTIKIEDTGNPITIANGQKMTFHLSSGLHKIIMKIGKVQYNREIVVNENKDLVSIYISFIGRTPNIAVDQPPYDAIALGIDPSYRLRAWNSKSGTGKIVWGTILAVMGIGGIVAGENGGMGQEGGITLLIFGAGLLTWGILRMIHR